MNRLSIEDLLQGRTLEETVDHALRAVVKQGRLAKITGTDQCHYRHPDDNDVRCIIGHIIPDSLYNESMEGMSVLGIVWCNEDTVIRRFLADLQFTHDDRTVHDVDAMLEGALTCDRLGMRKFSWLKPLVQRIIDDKESGRL